MTPRAPPHADPPWKTVSHCFRIWRLAGTRERAHGALRDQLRPAVWAPVARRSAIEPGKKPEQATAFAMLPSGGSWSLPSPGWGGADG